MKKLTDLEVAQKLEEIEREEPKQETTFEEAAEKWFGNDGFYPDPKQGFIEGAKWQKERSYSEKDLEVAFFEGQFGKYSFNDWIRQFKKK